jgi:ComF family protein
MWKSDFSNRWDIKSVKSLWPATCAACRIALNVCLPPRCLVCTCPVSDHGSLCVDCWKGIDFIVPPLCDRLGTPFEIDMGENILSVRAIATPLAVSRVRAVALYTSTTRQMVHRLKYGDRLDMASPMARMMAVAGAELLADNEVLIPVPLHPFRLWRRRFNQASELARGLSQGSGVPVVDGVLKRQRATVPQVGLKAAERARNVSGAFHIPESMLGNIRGKRVLLVDDVMTTGSTLDAAARILRRVGAVDVDALTFALVFDRV